MRERVNSTEVVDLFDAFGQARELNKSIVKLGGMEFEPCDDKYKLGEIQRRINEGVVGRRVTITDLGFSPEIKPIERYERIFTPREPNDNVPGERRIGGKPYGTTMFFQHKHRVKGKVVETDTSSGLLIIRPQGLWGLLERCLVKMIDDTTEKPLVDIAIR